MVGKIIFVPHYKESFKSLLPIAFYLRNNQIGVPHFVIYFKDNSQVIKTLQKNKIDFSIYDPGILTKIPVLGKIFRIFSDLIYSFRLANSLSSVCAMVCTVESNEFEYALISVLNRRNINTIVLQWAQTLPNEYEIRLGREGKKGIVVVTVRYLKECMKRLVEMMFGVKYSKLYGDGKAKYFAVMGKYYKQMFASQGVLKDKLAVTGHPEHDLLFELSQNIINSEYKHNILLDFGLDRARPVWVVAREAISHFKLLDEQKDKEDLRNVLKILLQSQRNVQIVLKLHPRDQEDYYAFIKEEFPNVLIINECDLYKLIAVCDLYIAQISSTMMWAIALDKPVISYDFNNQPFWHYFRDREGVVKADTPGELSKEVKTIVANGLSSENHQKYNIAQDKYMSLDGKACERITELLMKDNN